jgi:hypothetical protein
MAAGADAQYEPMAAYPAALAARVGEAAFAAEDYPRLRAEYGRHLILLLRAPGAGIDACLATTAVVKLGTLGRYVKAVPAGEVAGLVAPEALRQLGAGPSVLVCAPPLDAAMALALADMAAAEDRFFATSRHRLAALDAVLGFAPERVGPMVAGMVDRLEAAAAAHREGRAAVAPPTGEWGVYARGGGAPPPDRLAWAIKEYAGRPAGVGPPLPPLDGEEAEALLGVHGMLASYGMAASAGRLIAAALAAPAFALLGHHPEVFAGGRLGLRWADFGPPMLEHLLSEEFADAARRASRLGAARPYVLALGAALAWGVPHAPRDEGHARQRLRDFVGEHLDGLDLSRTSVTGSAIAAALIVTDVERERYERSAWHHYPANAVSAAVARATGGALCAAYDAWREWRAGRLGGGYGAYLAALYPPAVTAPRDRAAYLALVEMVRAAPAAAQVEFATGGGVLTLTARGPAGAVRVATLDVREGADVDLSVDAATDGEFDAIVRGHYAAVRARHPSAALARVVLRGEGEADPRHNWTITGAGFRPIELYRASPDSILTHHVGMVRGAYTARAGGAPQFVVAASLVKAMADLETPNYYYFASRKRRPQDIIMKYAMRGFAYEAFPAEIKSALRASYTHGREPQWRPDDHDPATLAYPALYGKGFFSAYSLPAEVGALFGVELAVTHREA